VSWNPSGGDAGLSLGLYNFDVVGSNVGFPCAKLILTDARSYADDSTNAYFAVYESRNHIAKQFDSGSDVI